MKRLTWLLAAMLLVGCVAGQVAPDVSGYAVIGKTSVPCPDGTMINLTYYDADVNDPDALVIVYDRAGTLVGVLDVKHATVYVYAERKAYSVDDAAAKYGNACGLPIKV